MVKVGLIGLLQSRKATFCLLILLVSSIGLLMGRIDGPSYAAVVGTLAVIYNYCQHRIDMATTNSNASIGQVIVNSLEGKNGV